MIIAIIKPIKPKNKATTILIIIALKDNKAFIIFVVIFVIERKFLIFIILAFFKAFL